MFTVQLNPSQGTRGQAVHAEVQCDVEGVSQVRMVVDAMGGRLDWSLSQQGDVWVADVRVPYDAPSDTYRLSFRAYNAVGKVVESTDRSFTVR